MSAFDTPKPDEMVWKILTAMIVYPVIFAVYWTLIYLVGRTVAQWVGL